VWDNKSTVSVKKKGGGGGGVRKKKRESWYILKKRTLRSTQPLQEVTKIINYKGEVGGKWREGIGRKRRRLENGSCSGRPFPFEKSVDKKI